MNCQGLISVKIVFVCKRALEALLHFFKSGCLFCHDFEGKSDNANDGILLFGLLGVHWID